jgi:hypothetical protein
MEVLVFKTSHVTGGTSLVIGTWPTGWETILVGEYNGSACHCTVWRNFVFVHVLCTHRGLLFSSEFGCLERSYVTKMTTVIFVRLWNNDVNRIIYRYLGTAYIRSKFQRWMQACPFYRVSDYLGLRFRLRLARADRHFFGLKCDYIIRR